MYSRRLIGRWRFSARLLTQYSVSCLLALPIVFIAIRYERSLSVPIILGLPQRFIAFLWISRLFDDHVSWKYKPPEFHLRDQLHATNSVTRCWFSRRPYRHASASWNNSRQIEFGFYESCWRKGGQIYSTNSARFRGSNRYCTHEADLQHCVTKEDTWHTSSQQGGWSQAMF